MKPSHEDEIEDGTIQTFKQYVGLIASDLRLEIETRSLPDHYERQAEKIDEQIEEVEAMDASILYDEFLKDYASRIRCIKDRIIKQNFIRGNFESILKEIEEWKCDSSMIKLKEEMIEDFQNAISIRDTTYEELHLKELRDTPIPQDGDQVKSERIEKLKKTRAQYLEFHNRDLERYHKAKHIDLENLQKLEKI